MDKITTTIRREPLADIVARRKRIEYRVIKPYWEKRFSEIGTPFILRLINGMSLGAPEATVRIERVRRNGRTGHFELFIGKVMETKFWDARYERPIQSGRRSRPRT
jgi:hypothetical protein